jgi:hypothetical protein
MRLLRVFQVAYNEAYVYERARLLRQHGYHVQSVIGNDAAKVMLNDRPRYDVFVVGSDAPEETRLEMVRWLLENYPRQRIVALNPPGQRKLDGLEFNANTENPAEWLPLIEEVALSGR